jgi:hypothetical protein
MADHTDPIPEESLSRREALKLAAAVAAFGAALGVRPANSFATGKEEGKGEMKGEGKGKAKAEGKGKAKGEGKGDAKGMGKAEGKGEGKATGK